MVPGGGKAGGGKGEVQELGRGHLSDVGVEVDQCLQRGAEAGGEVVPCHRDEEVLTPLKMEDQDVLHVGVASETGGRVTVDTHGQHYDHIMY